MLAIKQSPHVLETSFGEKKVIFSLKSYLTYILNQSASEIWDFCKRPRYINDIRAFLGREYAVSVSKTSEDVNRIVSELKKHGLVEVFREK
jgi:hypothetical protein